MPSNSLANDDPLRRATAPASSFSPAALFRLLSCLVRAIVAFAFASASAAFLAARFALSILQCLCTRTTHMSADHESSSGMGSHMSGNAFRTPYSIRSRISPGGMSHSHTRRTSSNATRLNGTLPSGVSGTFRDLMKCTVSTLDVPAPMPSGGGTRLRSRSRSAPSTVPLPSSNS